MIKTFISIISQAIGFSKTETRGSFLLILIIFLSIILSRSYIQYLKSTSRIEDPEISALDNWAQEVQASISNKELTDTHTETKVTDIQKVVPSEFSKKKKVDSIRFNTNKPSAKAVKESIRVRDLNAVNADQLQVVKGIGPVFANRIIKFRERLGGFSSESQLTEVYGIPPETLAEMNKYFVVQSTPKRLNINADSAKVLARHPYISYDLAWIIINYRKQHGDITSSADLKKIQAIDSQTFVRLKPYID